MEDEGELHEFLTLTPDKGECSASHSDRFVPEERRWVGWPHSAHAGNQAMFLASSHARTHAHTHTHTHTYTHTHTSPTAIQSSRVENILMSSVVTHPDTRERPVPSRVPMERRCRGAGIRCSRAPPCCAYSCTRAGLSHPELSFPRTPTHGRCICTCARRNAFKGNYCWPGIWSFYSGNKEHSWPGLRSFYSRNKGHSSPGLRSF